MYLGLRAPVDAKPKAARKKVAEVAELPKVEEAAKVAELPKVAEAAKVAKTKRAPAPKAIKKKKKKNVKNMINIAEIIGMQARLKSWPSGKYTIESYMYIVRGYELDDKDKQNPKEELIPYWCLCTWCLEDEFLERVDAAEEAEKAKPEPSSEADRDKVIVAHSLKLIRSSSDPNKHILKAMYKYDQLDAPWVPLRDCHQDKVDEYNNKIVATNERIMAEAAARDAKLAERQQRVVPPRSHAMSTRRQPLRLHAMSTRRQRA
jgi:hypothetical protein